MNLEDSILTLAASMERLAFALEKGFIVATEVPKAEPEPVEKKTRKKKEPVPSIPGTVDVTPKANEEELPAPDPEPEQFPAGTHPAFEAADITNDQLREALVALSDKATKETARKLLATIGKAATISQVLPAYRAPLLAAIEEAMNAAKS